MVTLKPKRMLHVPREDLFFPSASTRNSAIILDSLLENFCHFFFIVPATVLVQEEFFCTLSPHTIHITIVFYLWENVFASHSTVPGNRHLIIWLVLIHSLFRGWRVQILLRDTTFDTNIHYLKIPEEEDTNTSSIMGCVVLNATRHVWAYHGKCSINGKYSFVL